MRVTIKPSEYRGEAGWLISGTDHLRRRLRVFCKTQETAEAVRQRIRAARAFDDLLLAERGR